MTQEPPAASANAVALSAGARIEGRFAGARAWALLGALFLVSMLCQIDRILPFILADSIKRDLGLSDAELGLITGAAFAICYALMSLPLARAADRGSPRLVLVLCILLWSAMTSLGAFAASFAMLATTRFGVALGEAGATPSAHALIARRVAPDKRGVAIAIFAMGIPIGTMVGFAGGGALADTLGWRAALLGAGAMGALLALIAFAATGPTPPVPQASVQAEPFVRASIRLLSAPSFRWLFISAIIVGFAATPFYAFAAPFLTRTFDISTSQVGLAFGLLQGSMGIIGTLAGGRGFDRALRTGSSLLGRPALLFLFSSVTTSIALFAPVGWVAIVLFIPAMLAFAFMMPLAFGAAHFVAGRGNEAMATSLMMVGSGLLGPALGPYLVGALSDAAGAAGFANSLGLALLLVPIAIALTGIAMLIADRRLRTARA